MRTVQLGEIIKGVRNTTTFGMVLCVASMIMIIKLQASWLTREYVDDLVTYLGLVEGTKKSEDCLRSKEDFICNVDLENPWVMEFILLEAVRKDFGEFISTEERTWMAEKEGGIVLSKNGSAPQSLWRLRHDLDIPSQELDIKESFRSYRIIVGIDGTIEVVRCTGGHIAFLTPSWHLDCERLPEKLEKTNRWLASIGQSHPAGLQNLS